MAGPGRLVLLFSLLFSSIVSVLAAKRIETIDDADDKVDPSARTRLLFYPAKNGLWNSNGGCTEDSPFCLYADPSKAQDGTWTATGLFRTEEPRKITIEFVGDSIDVFFTLVSKGPRRYTTRCTFIMDNSKALVLEKIPAPVNDTAVEFSYQEKVFGQHDLQHGSHKLEIVVPGWKGGPNYLNFDYAEYRFDDSLLETQPTVSPPVTPVSQSPTSIGYPSATKVPGNSSSIDVTKLETGKGVMQAAIVGGSISGAILVVSAILFLVYRSRQKRQQQSEEIAPSIPSTYAGSTKKLRLPFWPHKPAYADSTSSFHGSNLTSFPEKRGSNTSYASTQYGTDKYPEYLSGRNFANSQDERRQERASTMSHGPLLSPANALIQSFFPNRYKRESTTTGKLSRLEDSLSPASSKFPRHLSTFSDVRAKQKKQQEQRQTRNTSSTFSSSQVLPLQSPPASSSAGRQTSSSLKSYDYPV